MAWKRCDRCHKRQRVSSRQRRCHQVPHAAGAFSQKYWCYGWLVSEPLVTTSRVVEADASKTVRKLAQIDKRIAEKTAQVTRLGRAIQKLRRSRVYYEKRLAMSAEDVEAERQRRREKQEARANQRGARRAIDISRLND
jgi:hypothetical protein